jgi:hypothetical protein
MNTKTLTDLYSQLTPEERFRLLMAADARGDEAERGRLVNDCQRITLSMWAHAPYARAFEELNYVNYIDLLDQAAEFLDAHTRAENALRVGDAKTPKKRKTKATTPNEESAAKDSEDDGVKSPQWVRSSELVYVIGFFFKLNLAGWKRFCARWNVAPIVLWDRRSYPGLDRLRNTWALANAGLAYSAAADVVRWLNTVRPAGDPELTEANIMTAEWIADHHEAQFHALVRVWGG